MSIVDKYKNMSDASKILLYMLIGAILGIIFGEKATIVKPIGDIFIRLLMMAAIPLVFFNLLSAITGLSDVRTVGRISTKIMVYYLTTTAFAVTVGLVMMNIIKPGLGMVLEGDVPTDIAAVPSVSEIIIDLFTKNIVASFAKGNVAQIVVFAVILGVCTLFLPKDKKDALEKGFTLLADLFRKMVAVVLKFGPLGIGALAANTVGKYGSSIFGPLAKFIGAVWLADLFMILVYLILLATIAKMSPITFLKKSAPLYAVTTATCSSLASLTASMDIAEKRFKFPKKIYSFTLPLGAQLNKDGTSVFLAAVLIFTSQACGISLSIEQQISAVLIGLILSEGSGGIPGGGIVIGMIFVNAFGLPLEVGAIVAGIYRLIDMASTTINCMGDMVGTAIVVKSESKKNEYAFNSNQ
ncbi:MAG: dicarboxylate/amino acid:cation symporter [Clostridia bacterium]|nr:dicarboxylate/amino acid:cation symporter [Clostridia bacterium]